MLYFIVVMYCFLLYVYLYNWAAYLGQDTPGKEILFYLSEVLFWLIIIHVFLMYIIYILMKYYFHVYDQNSCISNGH